MKVHKTRKSQLETLHSNLIPREIPSATLNDNTKNGNAPTKLILNPNAEPVYPKLFISDAPKPLNGIGRTDPAEPNLNALSRPSIIVACQPSNPDRVGEVSIGSSMDHSSQIKIQALINLLCIFCCMLSVSLCVNLGISDGELNILHPNWDMEQAAFPLSHSNILDEDMVDFGCLSPSHDNPSTPNLSIRSEIEERVTISLNPYVKSFIPSQDFIPNDIINECSSSPEALNIDKDSPESILQNLRLKNVDRVIIGHININSIRNKFHLLADIIRGRVDIILISETKLDCTFPKPQFLLHGFSEPLRLDRTAYGGGLLLYLRDDIPYKRLPLISGNIECIIVDVTISKKKWLLIGMYNPCKSRISEHLSILEKSLCHYLMLYDNVVMFGDVNSEIDEEFMADFCNVYNLKSLIKVPTCFKSPQNPSCIDLILTNKPRSFQNSTALETGLSDFHLMTVTVLKTVFRKRPPKIIKYRDYKRYSPINFQHDLKINLAGIDLNKISNDQYVSLLMGILDRHAPLKTKYIRANDQPFMTKELRKEHMKRTRLKNKFLKNRTDANAIAYKKQRNLCVNLLKKVKRAYFEKLKPSSISDNKKFWKTVNPLFSEKTMSTENIALIENNAIVSEEHEVAEIFNSYFSNAVKISILTAMSIFLLMIIFSARTMKVTIQSKHLLRSINNIQAY